MIRRPPRATRTDTSFPTRRSSDLHVDDIASGVIAAMRGGPPGVYNLADDFPCSQNRVIEYACALLNVQLPPLQSLAEARLSRQGRDFYGENRRIETGQAKRLQIGRAHV